MKNLNIVNKTVSSKEGIDLKVVEKVNRLYWREVRKALVSLENEHVHIKKIGTLSISLFKTNNHIRRLIGIIRRVKGSSKYTDDTQKTHLENYYDTLKILLKKRNELILKYKNQ